MFNALFSERARACGWDMRLKYHDADEATSPNLNLCNINKVTLFWDESEQKTHASVE